MVKGPDVHICDECVELGWHMVQPAPGDPQGPPRKKDARGDGGALSCSFCGKREDEIEKLIGGIEKYICDACIGKAVAELE